MLLLLHAAATLFMAGVIWVIQVVHYPMFDQADRADFPRFAKRHSIRISGVIAVPMLVEAATVVALVAQPRPGINPVLAWTGLALLVIIWVSTAWLQVPAHGRLGYGWSAEAHRKLVRTNWIRTAAWTLRALLALWLLATAGSGPVLAMH